MKSPVALIFFILIPLLALILPACSSVEEVNLSAETEGSTATENFTPTALPPTATATQTETQPTSTPSPLPTATETATASMTLTVVPTEVSLDWPTLPITLTNVSKVEQIGIWGRGSPDQVMSAGEGKLLLVRSPFGLAVYKTGTSDLVVFLPEVRDLAISADTTQIAAAYPGGVVEVLDADGLEVRYRFEHTLEVPKYPPPGYDPDLQLMVQSLAFSPMVDLLAVGYGDGTIDLYDLGRGELEFSLHTNYTPLPSKLVFSPDQRYLLSSNQGSGGGRINIGVWSMETGEVAGYLPDSGRFSDNPFSPDGKTIVTSKWGGFLIRTSLPEGVILGSIPTGLFYPSVEYAIDSRYLVVDGGAQVRKIIDGTQVQMDAEDLEAIKPDPPSWQVELAGRQAWDLGHPSGLFAVRIGEDQELAAWGGDGEAVYRWNLGHETQVQEYPWKLEPGVISVARDQSILAACVGSRLLVMDTDSAEVKDWGSCQPDALDFSPGDDMIAKANLGLIYLLHTPDGDLAHNLRGHNLTPQIVRYSPDGRYLISGNISDGRCEVFLWQTEPAAGLQQITFDDWGLRDLAVSSDAAFMVTAGDKLRIWRVSDGWQLKYLSFGVSRLAFHPQANLLAIGDYKGAIHLMSIPNGEVLGILDGHRGPITDLRFSLDGTVLVSASKDGTVRLWGIKP